MGKYAVIGGVIGTFLGGPVGAVAGAALGAMVGNGEDYVDEMSEQELLLEELLSIYIPILAKMASSDGHVDEVELEIINDLVTTISDDEESIQNALKMVSDAVDDNKTIYDYADEFKEVSDSREARENMYNLLFVIAYADGILDPKEEFEKELLTDNYNADELLEAYEVLGCTRESSDDEIKKAWRNKCMDFHPDKLASKGLDDSFINFAKEQMQKINDAYKIIRESSGTRV